MFCYLHIDIILVALFFANRLGPTRPLFANDIIIIESVRLLIHSFSLSRFETTQVITADHMEYVFQEGEENEGKKSSTTSQQYEINLILPTEITLRKDKQINRCSNECSICMLEYDAGDVVVCSKHCSHVFHQECILNWFSHSNSKSGESNRNCPSCRCNFWDVDDDDDKQKGGGGLRGNRSRSDTEETAALSVTNAEYSRGREDSIDNENALSPVAED